MPSWCDDFVDSHESREDELVTDFSVAGRFDIAGLDRAEPAAELLDAVVNECPSHEYLLSMDDLLPGPTALMQRFH
jgi:hypothetical protein